jgi:hypothetical protein
MRKSHTQVTCHNNLFTYVHCTSMSNEKRARTLLLTALPLSLQRHPIVSEMRRFLTPE